MIQLATIPHFTNKLCREEALKRLSRYGIVGKMVYLIDLIPLIEMIWTGGQLQPEKINFLYHYSKQHLRHINQMAGYVVLSMADATKFTEPYLASHPNMAHLRKIRECIMPVRLGETRSDYGDMIMRRIMSACVNILSISLAQYPHDLQNRCGSEERGMYLDIIESFGMYYFGAERPSDIGLNGEKTHECYPAD